MCIYKDRFKTLNHVFMFCIMWMEISEKETFQKAFTILPLAFCKKNKVSDKGSSFFAQTTPCQHFVFVAWGSIKKTYWAF